MTGATSTIAGTSASAPAVAGYHDGRVRIGHAAATGLPVDYVARTERRLCNGLIIGATGSGTTTLAAHIADTLRGTGAWLVRHVRADAGRDRANELHLLCEAEHRAGRPGRQREPLHLVVWDGFAQLAADPVLQGADFVGRVSELAQHGPEYGVAQLVIANPDHLHTDTGTDIAANARLRALLSDNVIALRINERIEHQLGGYMITPTRLPREHGHALVLVAETHYRRDTVHTHLDRDLEPEAGLDAGLGRVRTGCGPCQRAMTAERGEGTGPDQAGDTRPRDGATR
jgi:hypothetical protein